MDAQMAFDNILDSDETIVESFKPNKLRTVLISILRDLLVDVIVAALGAVFLAAAFNPKVVDDNGNRLPPIIGIIILSIAGLAFIASIFFRLVRFNKTWFCYTNKRIIIRSGFIGADYKTLDFDAVTAVDVRVDFLDKLVKPNTGVIIFGAASAPMMMRFSGNADRARHEYGYCFYAIPDPYNAYKRIKEYIAEARENKEHLQ